MVQRTRQGAILAGLVNEDRGRDGRSESGERDPSPADHPLAVEIPESLVVLDGVANLPQRLNGAEPDVETPDEHAGVVDHHWEGRRGLIRILEPAAASPEVVYAALESLQHHMDWAGKRHDPQLQHVVLLKGPSTLEVGDRFTTTQHTKLGYWLDNSVVVEAHRPDQLGFDTEGTHYLHSGRMNATGQWQHRYRLEPGTGGCLIRYSCRWVLTKGRVDVYAAAIIAATVHRGVRNLVALAEELFALPAPVRTTLQGP
jgi:hypothetical protein